MAINYDLTNTGPEVQQILDESAEHAAAIEQLQTGKQDVIEDLEDIRYHAMYSYEKPVGGIPKSDLSIPVAVALDRGSSAYQLPSGGIPKGDLASAVQTSLGKADTAIQEVKTINGESIEGNGNINVATDISGKVDKTTTVNGHALSSNVNVTKGDVGLGNVTNDAQIPLAQKGVAGGVASLGSDGKVPSSQLPEIDISGKVDKTTTVNGHALSEDVTVTKGDVGLGNVTNDAQIPLAQKGVAGGVASLGSDGKVPSSQLPDIDISGKADKATTLAGYGITDGYTKAEGQALETEMDNRMDAQDDAIDTRMDAQDAVIATLHGNTVVVVADHTAVSSPAANTIYREQGTSSYTDWMYDISAWKKIAEYSMPGIDNEPTEGSNNLVKSGGVFSQIDEINTAIFGSEAKQVDILDSVVRNAGYVDSNGKVTSYQSTYFYSDPILLNTGDMISVNAGGGGVSYLSTTDSATVAIGDTLSPVGGKSYVASGQIYVVISSQVVQFTSATILKQPTEGLLANIKTEVLDSSVEAFVENKNVALNLNCYFDTDKVVQEYSGWYCTKPILLKKNDFVIGNFRYVGTCSSESLAVGDTLKKVVEVNCFGTEKEQEWVSFSARGTSCNVTIYHMPDGSVNEKIGSLSAQINGGDVSNFVSESNYDGGWIAGKYIPQHPSNSEAISHQNYIISEPISLKAGESVKATVYGVQVCPMAFVTGEGTTDSPYKYTEVYNINIIDNKNDVFPIIYTATTDCKIAVCSNNNFQGIEVSIIKAEDTHFESIDDKIKEASGSTSILDVDNTKISSAWNTYGNTQYAAMLDFYKAHPNKSIPFFISTDMHGQGVEQHRWAHNIDVDDVNFANIMLGDNTIADNQGTGELEALRARTKDVKNYVPVVGNHDVTSFNTGVTFFEVAKNFKTTIVHFKHSPTEQNCIVAYDDIRNVKYISLSDYICREEDTIAVKNDFIEWLIHELSLDDGYDIVILKHWPYNRFYKNRDGSTFSNFSGGWHGGSWEIVQKRASKTSGTYTYGGITYNFDFSGCKTDLLCVLHGHEHHEMYSASASPRSYAAKCYMRDGYGGDDFTHSCVFGIIDRENRMLRIWMWHEAAAMPELDIPLDDE